MSKGVANDKTSLGSILVEWGVITKAQLEQALEEQKRLSREELLGKLLIANGVCTEDEIVTAMSAQKSMRAVGKHASAMAVADIAIERRRRKSIVERRQRIAEKADSITKSITSDAYPVITPSMLAKRNDG